MERLQFRLKVSLLGAFGRAFGITFLLFLIFSFLLFTGYKLLFLRALLAVFVALFAYYAYFRWYSPAFPLQVSIVMLATPKRVKLIQMKGEPPEEHEFKLEQLRPTKISLKDYIHEKSNRNVLITGSSGQGKSKLTRHLLSQMQYQKAIFSFKAGEEYLKMGYAVRDISKMLPDPFSNPEAFISAFVVAFPISSVGIQASLVPTTLEKLVKKSNSWQALGKAVESEARASKDSNTKSALAFIKAHISRLAYDTPGFSIGSEPVVLDFSSLNEDAKSFYAELVLRQLYSDMEQGKRKDMLICVDEAHRLTTGSFARYHTILAEMSREIRNKGMLWITTQNYTDIPDGIRNQFASQFIFKTTSQNDLIALRAIEPLLAWTVSSLPKHYFVDAQFQDIHTQIPVFYYNPKGEKDVEAAVEAESQSISAQPAQLGERPTATQHAAMLALYNNPQASLSELAKYVIEKGWITGAPTIYGSKGRPGIFDALVKLGYAEAKGKGYELTDKGLSWVDSSKIAANSKSFESDLHRKLVIKTVEKLHEDNALAIVPQEQDAPDLIAYPMSKGKKKYLWDDANRRAYEIQTTARKENVIANMERDRKLGLAVTWVAYDEQIMEEIKKITENKDEYLLIKV
jgi:hypothetical protein